MLVADFPQIRKSTKASRRLTGDIKSQIVDLLRIVGRKTLFGVSVFHRELRCSFHPRAVIRKTGIS
jgi:hypothetical protein